jgi:hypothetical protein
MRRAIGAFEANMTKQVGISFPRAASLPLSLTVLSPERAQYYSQGHRPWTRRF